MTKMSGSQSDFCERVDKKVETKIDVACRAMAFALDILDSIPGCSIPASHIDLALQKTLEMKQGQ